MALIKVIKALFCNNLFKEACEIYKTLVAIKININSICTMLLKTIQMVNNIINNNFNNINIVWLCFHITMLRFNNIICVRYYKNVKIKDTGTGTSKNSLTQ